MKTKLYYICILVSFCCLSKAYAGEVTGVTIVSIARGDSVQIPGNITIAEGVKTDFSDTGEDFLKYTIKTPDGFAFGALDDEVDYLDDHGGGYVEKFYYLSHNNTRFNFEYKLSGTTADELNSFVIKNLYVKAISATSGGTVTRIENAEDDAVMSITDSFTVAHITIQNVTGTPLDAPTQVNAPLPVLYRGCNIDVLDGKIEVASESDYINWYFDSEKSYIIEEVYEKNPDASDLSFDANTVGVQYRYVTASRSDLRLDESSVTPIALYVVEPPEVSFYGLEESSVCESSSDKYILVGDHPGGRFVIEKDGGGTTYGNNPYELIPSQLGDGTFDIYYEYTSPAGCKVTSSTETLTINPEIQTSPKWTPDSTTFLINDFPNGYDLVYGVNDIIDIDNNTSAGTFYFEGPGVFENRFYPAVVGVNDNGYEITYVRKGDGGTCDSISRSTFYVNNNESDPDKGNFDDHTNFLGEQPSFCSTYDTQYVEIRRVPTYERTYNDVLKRYYERGTKYYIDSIHYDTTQARIVQQERRYNDSADVYTLALYPAKATENKISITVFMRAVTQYGADYIEDPSRNYSYEYTYMYSQELEIGVVTTPATEIIEMDSSFCASSDKRITFISTPSGGSVKYYKLEDTPVELPDPYYSPDQLETGDYRVYYSKANLHCSATDSFDFSINPAPNPVFTVNSPYCFGDTVTFEAPSNTGATFIWDLGDNSQSSDTLFNYLYEEPNKYQVKLTVEQGEGADKCSDEHVEEVVVGAIPKAAFNFRSVCEGDTTFFINKSSIFSAIPDDTIKYTQWNFGDAKTSSNKSPFNIYQTTGVFPVNLSVESEYGCSSSLSKNISIFKKREVLAADSYKEDFENEIQWVSTKDNGLGSNSSWSLIEPFSHNINNSEYGKAWITFNAEDSSYSSMEKSWVESPCFILDDLSRPMISLKTWTDIEPGVDGAVLQYVIDDKSIEDSGFVWKTLGDINTGEFWYNYRGINSSPGDQGGGSYGWSGYSNNSGWLVSKLGLDEIKSDPDYFEGAYVRFRIAFASNAANPRFRNFSGFAFDDVFIGERRRLVVMEHFTNVNEPYSTDKDVDDFVDASNEVVKLQYHINFPDNDPINLENRADPSARALLYGIAIPQRSVLDGIFQQDSSFATGWVENTYSRRTLSNTAFSIDASVSVESGKLKVASQITAIETDREISGPYLVHTAIVQKERSYNGRIYRNVVEKMLPNAAGTRFESLVSADTSVTVFWNPSGIITDSENYMLVVFIQDESTKEIYQATYMDIDPSMVDQLEVQQRHVNVDTNTDVLRSAIVYPNPTKGDYSLRFDQALPENYQWKLLNVFGEVVGEGTLGKGNKSFLFSSDSYTTGVYNLQLMDGGSVVISRKVSVLK